MLRYYLRWLRRRSPEMFDGDLALATVNACIEEYSARAASR